MTAENIYTIAKELSKEELLNLYNIIGNKLGKPVTKTKKRKNKNDFFSKQEADNYILKNVFNVKIK